MSGPGSKLTETQKEELMDQVKQQLAVANAQELLTVSEQARIASSGIHSRLTLAKKISEKCFNKCVNKPGSSLDGSEQKCIAMCMDRYMDSWNLVSKSYSSRLQRERHRM